MQMRAVAARQGTRWFADGWSLFQQRPGMWIMLGLIDLLVTIVLYELPYASDLTAVFTVLWSGGMVFAADHCRTTGTVGLADVVRGIRAHFEPLFAAAVFGLLIAIVCDLTGDRAAGALRLMAFGGAKTDLPTVLALCAGVLYLTTAVIGAMALWIAPALIVLNGATRQLYGHLAQRGGRTRLRDRRSGSVHCLRADARRCDGRRGPAALPVHVCGKPRYVPAQPMSGER